jgi:Flp pilus assembly protein TadG
MKSRLEFQPKNSNERGQSLVELALTITLLFVLLAGIVDLGSAFFSFIALRDAAQEGALYGSIHPDDTGVIEARVRSASDRPVDLSGPNVAVDVDPGTACEGGELTVTVTYTYQISMPFIGAILNTQEIPIRASVTDTILSPACDD